MGLFDIFTKGLTIEKKKKHPEAEIEIEEEIEEIEQEPEEVEIAPMPASMPSESNIIDKKEEAKAVLYGTAEQPHTTPTEVASQPVVEPVIQPKVEEVKARPQVEQMQKTYSGFNSASSGFGTALSGQTVANQNLLIVSPKTADEISPILSNLASGNACIVSLAHISNPQRHLDYLCGFMNAIGGTIMKRTDTEYVLTPQGVGIRS